MSTKRDFNQLLATIPSKAISRCNKEMSSKLPSRVFMDIIITGT